MSKTANWSYSLTLLLAALGGARSLSACGTGNQAQAQTQASGLQLASNDIQDGGLIASQFTANGFGCNGQNLSPELHWSNVPTGTKSLVLTMYDPDAPTGSGFYHWTVYNLPATATGLARGAGNAAATLPAPAYGGQNDFQDTGVTGNNGNYGGPCPPAGDPAHRYVFTLYALAVPDIAQAAGIPKTGTSALYGFALQRGLGSNVLGKASLIAKYGR